MAGRSLTEPELRAALARCDPEDRALLVWLATGKTVPASTVNGTA